MNQSSFITLNSIQPYIRYVNYYKPSYSYTEMERQLYDYEFMYVMQGKVEMHYDNHIYSLKKGDLFLLEPFVPNRIVVDETDHFQTHCIHFDWIPPVPEEDFKVEDFYLHDEHTKAHDHRKKLLQKRDTPKPSDYSLPNHITGIPFDILSPLFSSCYCAYLEHSSSSRLKVTGYFYEILAGLLQYENRISDSVTIHPQILKSLLYIEQHYCEHLTVAELSTRFHLSPKYYGTLFTQATGKKLNQYILDLRLFDAKEMLLGSNLTIEQISEKIGFQNAFYFSRCFKEHEHVSPSAYRNTRGH